MNLLGIWIASFLTLCIFSFLYRDNPFFRFAESVFAGVSLGYYIGQEADQTIRPNLITPLMHDFGGNWDLLIPALIGINLYTRYIPKANWWARWSLAIYVGYYVGVNMVQKLHGEVLPQMQSTIVPFTHGGGNPRIRQRLDPVRRRARGPDLLLLLGRAQGSRGDGEPARDMVSDARIRRRLRLHGHGARVAPDRPSELLDHAMGNADPTSDREGILMRFESRSIAGGARPGPRIGRGAAWLVAAALLSAVAPQAARAIPPLAATFSIVARDTTTGEIGVGVSSHWFSVGTSVPWAEANVGAVATQSFVEKAYGPNLLARMRRGERATDALVAEIEADTLRALRQVLVIDAKGNCGAHTGERCMPFAGHHVGRTYACAGNLLLSPDTWDRMGKAFENAQGQLGARILAALEEGQAAGGDARGKQSAALIVYKMVDPDNPWKNKTVDLRVEDNANPVYELGRLYKLHLAYTLADQGDECLREEGLRHGAPLLRRRGRPGAGKRRDPLLARLDEERDRRLR